MVYDGDRRGSSLAGSPKLTFHSTSFAEMQVQGEKAVEGEAQRESTRDELPRRSTVVQP